MVSSGHRVASTSARSGWSAGRRSRAISKISTLSASMLPGSCGEAPVVGEGGGHETIGVAEVAGPASGVEEGVAERGDLRSGVGRCRARWPRSMPRSGSGSAAWA